MSAYMVSDLHISAVINKMVEMELINKSNINKVGQMIVDENINSLVARYGEAEKAENSHTFQFIENEETQVSDIQAHKLAHCIEYQSCEHDQWKDSKAFRTLDKLCKAIEKKTNRSYKTLRDKDWNGLLWSM